MTTVPPETPTRFLVESFELDGRSSIRSAHGKGHDRALELSRGDAHGYTYDVETEKREVRPLSNVRKPRTRTVRIVRLYRLLDQGERFRIAQGQCRRCWRPTPPSSTFLCADCNSDDLEAELDKATPALTEES